MLYFILIIIILINKSVKCCILIGCMLITLILIITHYVHSIDFLLCTIILQIQLHVLTVVVGQYMDLDHILHAVHPIPHCLAVALIIAGGEQTHIFATQTGTQ